MDQEGYIQDFTASFRNIFYRISKKVQAKNIQEIIPNYFESTPEGERDLQPRTIEIQMRNNKLGPVEATFQILPINVKGEYLGFLINMTYRPLELPQKLPLIPFTQWLMDRRLEEELYCFRNSYSERTNSFILCNSGQELLEFGGSNSFTLPYLKFQDMVFLATQDEARRFGVGIRTIRFIHGHFERIDDSESFSSEDYSEEGNLDHQITQMRQQSEGGS